MTYLSCAGAYCHGEGAVKLQGGDGGQTLNSVGKKSRGITSTGCDGRLRAHRGASLHTLSPQRGCSGRSPASPLGSEHAGPNIPPFPGDETEETSHGGIKKFKLETLRKNINKINISDLQSICLAAGRDSDTEWIS